MVCVELELSADRPLAMVAVRLSDVAPDGKATRVTYGMLNLDPSRLPRASRTPRARAALPRAHQDETTIAQSFPAGHRLRLAVSTSYWPLAWPSPEPVRLTIHPGQSADRAAGPSTEAGGCHPARIRPARGRAGDPAAENDRGGPAHLARPSRPRQRCLDARGHQRPGHLRPSTRSDWRSRAARTNGTRFGPTTSSRRWERPGPCAA